MTSRSISMFLAVLSSAVVLACGGSNAGGPGPFASSRTLENGDDAGGADAGTNDDALPGEEEDEGCTYTLQYDPVCGVDGTTYTNSGHAACERVEVAHEGECDEDGCTFTLQYDPVCGVDGTTYTNSAHAACKRVEVAHEGECDDEGCVFTLQYDPVCGVDGTTYTNSAHAACKRVEVAHEGACNE